MFENFGYRRLKKLASGFDTKFILSLSLIHSSEKQLLAYKEAAQAVASELGFSIENPKQRMSDRSQDSSPFSLVIWSANWEAANPFDGVPPSAIDDLEKLTSLLPQLPEGSHGFLRVHVFYGDVFGDFILPLELVRNLAKMGFLVEFCGELSA